MTPWEAASGCDAAAMLLRQRPRLSPLDHSAHGSGQEIGRFWEIAMRQELQFGPVPPSHECHLGAHRAGQKWSLASKTCSLFCRFRVGKIACIRVGGWGIQQQNQRWILDSVRSGVIKRDLHLRRCGCFREGNEGDNETQHHVLATDSLQFASEREEAKAIMIQFLKTFGLSSTLSVRITKKAVQFMAHLVTLLHTRYRLRYLTGRELTTAEIRNTLLPYLEALSAEHGKGLVDVLVYFPNPPPPKEYYRKGVVPNAKAWIPKSVQKQGLTVNGNFRPSVSYALSLGLSLEQVQAITNRFPCLLFYSPERSIIPVVDYLLALGIPKLGIQKIFLKRPQIFGCSLDENLKPTMAYLESVGVEKSQWPRILVNFPALLTYGKENLQETVAFLSGVGLSAVNVGWIITRFPQVVSYSVEGKLSSTVEFFKNIGLTDISSLVRRSPQVLGYSVEGNIKPTVRFLIELGFDQKDVITMISRFPPVLGLAIDNNIKRKWDYFSLTGWPKRYIVAFPQYFGYSLEGRIKPRFKVVLKYGLCWTPSRILSLSDREFQKLLERELEQNREAFITRPGSHATSSARTLCENG